MKAAESGRQENYAQKDCRQVNCKQARRHQRCNHANANPVPQSEDLVSGRAFQNSLGQYTLLKLSTLSPIQVQTGRHVTDNAPPKLVVSDLHQFLQKDCSVFRREALNV